MSHFRHRRILLAVQCPDQLDSEWQEVPQTVDGHSSAPTGSSPTAGPSGMSRNTSYSGSSSEYNPASDEDESSDDGTAYLSRTHKRQPQKRRLLRPLV
ncbi:hypothetical protein JTB14_038362 [Gonioctena quinquepunctata]|nr:hypothetical protein JTB14_038362 [Gonioctena quinquepunctata]